LVTLIRLNGVKSQICGYQYGYAFKPFFSTILFKVTLL